MQLVEIEFNSKADLRFSLLTMWGLATIFVLGAVFTGPARDEDGTFYADWETRALIGKMLILAIVILPTTRRKTIVNRERHSLMVYDRILFVVPIGSITMSFNDVTSISLKIGDHEDNRALAILSVHSAKTKRRVLFRHDQENFVRYRQIADELSKIVGVQLTVIDTKSPT